MAGQDIFRSMKMEIQGISIVKADMEIDSTSGKTVINFELLVEYSQLGSTLTHSALTYSKTHKQIKHLIRDHGLTMPKVKYLPNQEQINKVSESFEQLMNLPHFLEKTSSSDFFTRDYLFKKQDTSSLNHRRASCRGSSCSSEQTRNRKMSYLEALEVKQGTFNFGDNNPLRNYIGDQ
jgi:hypothetical protein